MTGLFSKYLWFSFLVIDLLGCRSLSWDSQTKDAAPGLSPQAFDGAAYLHNQVLVDLRTKHRSAEGQTFFDTQGRLPEGWVLQTPDASSWGLTAAEYASAPSCAPGSNACDATLGLRRCIDDIECGGAGASCRTMQSTVWRPDGEALKVCVNNTDFFYEKIYQLVTSAKTSVDIVSLTEPTGRVRAALLNAISYLGYGDARPEIRLLFGGRTDAAPNITSSPKKQLDIYMKDIKALNPGFPLRLTYGWLANGGTSWNHSKIVVVDAKSAVAGGQNLWEEPYLSKTPVHDLSILVTGSAAAGAQGFANTLWSNPIIRSVTYPSGSADKSAFAMPSDKDGDVPMIAVGTLGNLGDRASEDALISLVVHARNKLQFVQQDFYNRLTNPLFPSPTYLLDAIGDAVLRGVDVTIVQSMKGGNGGYGMVAPEVTYSSMVTAFVKKAQDIGLKRPDIKADICSHLHIAPFHFSKDMTWPDGQTLGTHAKYIMADDAAFYVGSHNAYPAGLQEFGFMVFDSAKAKEIQKDFWDRIWGASQEFALPCP